MRYSGRAYFFPLEVELCMAKSEIVEPEDFKKITQKGFAIVKLVAPEWCEQSRKLERLLRDGASSGLIEPVRSVAAYVQNYTSANFFATIRHISIDADANPWLAQELKLKYVPTVYLYRDGLPISQRIGCPSNIEKFLNYCKKLNDPRVGTGKDNEGHLLMDVF